MWPVIHQAFRCWLCNAKHRFAGQAIKVSAFMLVPSPLPWCWHCSLHSAHPCIFWLCTEPLVLYWESKWCQHCDRKEEGDRAAWKPEGLWVLCFCQLQVNSLCRIPHCDWSYGEHMGTLGGWDSRSPYLWWGSSHQLCHGCIHASNHKIHL